MIREPDAQNRDSAKATLNAAHTINTEPECDTLFSYRLVDDSCSHETGVCKQFSLYRLVQFHLDVVWLNRLLNLVFAIEPPIGSKQIGRAHV